MNYIITRETLESLAACRANSHHSLRWDCIFVLPGWLKVWRQELGNEAELLLISVKQGETIVGIAPLMVRDGTASFLGSVDVCDYQDFITTPGMERDFFNVLLDDLKQRGITQLDLGHLRPDATVLTHLTGIARNRGYEVLCQPEDVSLEVALPSTWEEYLVTLTTQQRHEVKRKLRRLAKAGKIDYHFIKDSTAVPEAMSTFLKMFTQSREDKATFLTPQKESFLRSLADTMAEAGVLRLGVLELDRLPVAMTMCFDYNNCLYLYNSGYYPQYSSLSVGLLAKVLCIQESIAEGKKKFDLLKGNETYKHHLGGQEVPLYRCQINIR